MQVDDGGVDDDDVQVGVDEEDVEVNEEDGDDEDDKLDLQGKYDHLFHQ